MGGEYYHNVEEIRDGLKRQLVEPLKWQDCADEVAKSMHGHSAFLEAGPGKQLRAMMRRVNQEAWAKMSALE